MRLYLLLFILAIMNCHAEGLSQNVTINGNNLSVKAVFRSVELQTGYVVFGRKELIANARPVTVRVQNMPLSEFLEMLVRDQPFTFRITEKNIILTPLRIPSSPVEAGTSMVNRDDSLVHYSGTVKSQSSGLPLPGVTVSVKGSQTGTATDESGRYQLDWKGGTLTLLFSYVGYIDQEITLQPNGRTVNDIQLVEKDSALEEVVTIAMGNQQSKRSIVGAVATIQTKELKQSPVANLSNALAGRLPGLFTVQSSGQPGEDASALYIRGISTYGSNKSPLVVIDGLPRSGVNFQQIDANEIESVSILKDASSTALYGIQGANGVIVVTTKRGKTGKPSVNFTAQNALQQPVRLPQLMSSYETAVYENTIARNDGEASKWSDEQLEKFRNGSDPYLYPN
ncbi:MAG TPA: TonB-dependent receptor plug domain-containing protein, partial [Niabella sp.]|nr:TonB-dependent receptor plug domain-containing protein [Niabella sp.]